MNDNERDPKRLHITPNFAPTAEEINLHYRKFTEYVLDLRPDLADSSQPKVCSLNVKDDLGKVVGGAYMYCHFGSAVLEWIWIEPKFRGPIFVRLVRQVLAVAREWGCIQITGFSSDFLGTASAIERFGARRFGQLEVPERGFAIDYYVLRFE